MRLVPTSLAGRLLLAGAVLTAVAVLAAALLIGGILHRFITGQVDQRLDAQLTAITGALEVDGEGRVRLRQPVDGPPFDRLGSGWYWQATGGGIALKSRSLGAGSLDHPPMRFEWRRLLGGPPPGADVTTAAGEDLHLRSTTTTVGREVVTIVASAPATAINRPLREALLPLLASLAVLGALLVAASLLQVRLGLRPLRRLQADVAAVRAGKADHIAGSEVREMRPLVEEMNALIAQNAASLSGARRNVANLAHGIKTPLATLSLELQDAGLDRDGTLRGLVEQVEKRVRHHLGRARAAATGQGGRGSTVLLPRLADLGGALARIHADRRIGLDMDVGAQVTLACDAQDVDEMVGNLMDNAFTWARSRVAVTAALSGGSVVIRIEDDGPGIPPREIAAMMLPGRRADESVPGHGFGLAIAGELAELYGGSVALGASPLGGVLVVLELPSAG